MFRNYSMKWSEEHDLMLCMFTKIHTQIVVCEGQAHSFAEKVQRKDEKSRAGHEM